MAGRVRRIEPCGFTEISALGVEEQRVNVILDCVGPEASPHLAHGGRVEARIVVWQADDGVQGPLAALVRVSGGTWVTFVADAGRGRLQRVEIGRANDRVAEVRDGLAPGQQVVLYPGERVADGVRSAPER